MNVVEYIEILSKLYENIGIGKKNDNLIFRGESNCEWVLCPGIYRKRKGVDVENLNIYKNSENQILQHFIAEAISYKPQIGAKDYLTWMSYAQHFDAPTRILDFTENPMIALFFCCKDKENDGAVYILDENKYREIVVKNDEVYMKNHINNGTTIRDILNDIIEHIKDNTHKCVECPITYIPYYVDNRMSVQGSRFMMWGSIEKSLDKFDKKDLNIGGLKLDNLNQEDLQKRFLHKIIIESRDKDKIIEELDKIGVNEKSIFPGMDGIGRYVKRRYDLRQNSIGDVFWNNI